MQKDAVILSRACSAESKDLQLFFIRLSPIPAIDESWGFHATASGKP
jgi:hypothetical protein